MLISHSKKFIFIHVYKVAGSSIVSVLRSFAHYRTKKNRILSILQIYPNIYSSDFHGHISALELKKTLPISLFDNYFKFTFVRNPWDWQVSLFHYARELTTHHQHNIIMKMSFDEYIDWRVHNDLHLQSQYICNQNGEILVDFIGKYEKLLEDFNNISNQIKISTLSMLPHLNSSKRLNYREYYNNNTRQIVQQAFEKDIQLFDYEF